MSLSEISFRGKIALIVLTAILAFPIVFSSAVHGVQKRRQVRGCEVTHLESNRTHCTHRYTIAMEPLQNSNDTSSANDFNHTRKELVYCSIVKAKEKIQDKKCIPKYRIGDVTNCSVTMPPCKNARFESSWVFLLQPIIPFIFLELYCFYLFVWLCFNSIDGFNCFMRTFFSVQNQTSE